MGLDVVLETEKSSVAAEYRGDNKKCLPINAFMVICPPFVEALNTESPTKTKN